MVSRWPNVTLVPGLVFWGHEMNSWWNIENVEIMECRENVKIVECGNSSWKKCYSCLSCDKYIFHQMVEYMDIYRPIRISHSYNLHYTLIMVPISACSYMQCRFLTWLKHWWSNNCVSSQVGGYDLWSAMFMLVRTSMSLINFFLFFTC